MALTEESQLKIDIEVWALIVKHSTPEQLTKEEKEEERKAENRKLDTAIKRCQQLDETSKRKV